MKHFVTGGAGFFGLHLIEKLLSEGQEVIVYDLEDLDQKYLDMGVSFVKGDILDQSKLIEAMKGADVVHHTAAALPISRSGKHFWKVNVEGTQNVLNSALENGVKKFLHLSTSSVYGVPKEVPVNENTELTPFGDYGKAKYGAEELCRKFRKEHDFDLSIVRPRTILGTHRLGIFDILFDWIEQGKNVYLIGNGKNLFQFVSADDLAEACYLMTVKECRNEDFNIGAEEYTTVGEDLEDLLEYAETGSKLRPLNAFFVRNVLRFFDLLKISPLVDYHYTIASEPCYFDVSKANRVLGWRAKDSNKKMLKESYDWYVRNHKGLDKQIGKTHRKSVKQGILSWLKKIS
ncbi:MAG: NAD(P)-dependent oxidoreductase [bacterium]|nr:NAD(P)-dependent oxidoreductase [bacterium]